MKNKYISSSKGFTILELLIATTVFSSILLVLTQVVIRLTGTYYHGVIQNQTLNVAKNITNNIVQQIQFTGGDIVIGADPSNWSTSILDSNVSSYESYLCVGPNQYVYQLGGRYDNISSQGSLVLSYNTQCSGAGPLIRDNNWDFRVKNPAKTISSNYYVDLIPKGMRLVKFKVNQQFGNLYKVDVKVAYGADASPVNTGIGFNTSTGDCNPNSSYCATTELVTYVEKTVQ
jgi:prepilin-type N-terminal cleavage/methylation domain-containing protein